MTTTVRRNSGHFKRLYCQMSTCPSKCSKRHKGRLGLILTALKLEDATIHSKIHDEVAGELYEIAGSPLSERFTWTCRHLAVKPFEVSGISADGRRHPALLNCLYDSIYEMLAIKGIKESKVESRILQTTRSSVANKDGVVAPVVIGYAVPYLHIPGLRIHFPKSRHGYVHVEVLDDTGISPSFQRFKIRLMDKLKLLTIQIHRKEMEETKNVKELLYERLEDFL